MKNLRMIVDGGSFDVAEAIRELAAAGLVLAPAEKSDDGPAKAATATTAATTTTAAAPAPAKRQVKK
jgi:hypothetical protein